MRPDQPLGQADQLGGIELERADLMVAGKGGDGRRRGGRRLRGCFIIDGHGGGSDAEGCDCAACGKNRRHATLLQMSSNVASTRTSQQPSSGSKPYLKLKPAKHSKTEGPRRD